MGFLDNPSEYELKLTRKTNNSEEESEGEGEGEGEEEEMVEVKVTKEKEYTEHDGVAKFVDGAREEYTFDSMNERENAIVLKDYDGYKDTSGFISGGGFYGKAFVTIPYSQLKSFETVERRTETMEYTTTKKVPESEVQD